MKFKTAAKLTFGFALVCLDLVRERRRARRAAWKEARRQHGLSKAH